MILLLILFPVWIIMAFIVASQGSKRDIGYFKSLIISLFLTPIFGLLIVLSSKRLPDDQISLVNNHLIFLKGLVALSILLVPIMVFLFLKTFGNNNYDLPIFYEKGVDSPFSECSISDSTQHFIPEFSFINQEGSSVGRGDMIDKITIVNFFFTSCPSICPKMSTEMERVNDMFRDDDKVQIMSISIDPTYDTPEILKEYAEKHHAEAGKWDFLTGGVQETYNLAKCGFIIPTIDGLGVPDDFIHSDKFVLIDEIGRIRGYYGGTSREDVDLLMLETKVLLHASEGE